MPSFVQVFIEKPVDVAAGRPFEDQLYRLRRKLEKHIIPMSCLSAACPVRQLFIKDAACLSSWLVFQRSSKPRNDFEYCFDPFSLFNEYLPSWSRAQPFRFLAHNGEINTLRGAENWMHGHQIEVYDDENSDSAKLENCMEYLYRQGRDIPQALLMMVPEAWSKEAGLTPELTALMNTMQALWLLGMDQQLYALPMGRWWELPLIVMDCDHLATRSQKLVLLSWPLSQAWWIYQRRK